MKYKKITSIIISIILCFCACQKSAISINSEESFYSDFSVQGNEVYILVHVLIENNTNQEKNITLTASFDNDVKNGLLKEAVLEGYLVNSKEKIIKLKKGENWLDIVFVGEYGGNNQKHDRLLPEIEINEV